MKEEEFATILLKNFPFDTTLGQRQLLDKLAEFILRKNANEIFVIKGYAGTGKTTIVRSLVMSLPFINGKPVLLAPTGRAAKVLTYYTKQQGYTIHKKIYIKKTNADGGIVFRIRENTNSNSVFIIDEASMISNGGGLGQGEMFGSRSLLEDLIQYVFNGVNCKLIFIGDTAQLPPVGLNISPALDIEYLKATYHFSIDSFELTEVLRQKESSGILINATAIRNQIKNTDGSKPHFILEQNNNLIPADGFKFNNNDETSNKYKDIIRVEGIDLEEVLINAYNNFGAEDVIVICRSNKRSNIFNQQIRARIRWQEDELSSGDYMMVVKNNYFWLPEESKAGFIANGDIIQLVRVGKIQEMHGFRFADVRIRMVDYPNEPELETRLLLDTIMIESSALSQADNKKLFDSVLLDYMDIPEKNLRFKKVKDDHFYNALQVKFAYATTCHKAQGGQWPCVFVEQGYLTDEMINTEYLRWLYTAISRATEKLYLINFNSGFFDK